MRQDRGLFISSISVLEIERGIAKLRRTGGGLRADRLAPWVERVLENFGPNILPVDVEVAKQAGTMLDAAVAKGRDPGVADILIAATAQAHDLLLLTRNVRHFEPLGISVHDPLIGVPD